MIIMFNGSILIIFFDLKLNKKFNKIWYYIDKCKKEIENFDYEELSTKIKADEQYVIESTRIAKQMKAQVMADK